MLRVGNGGWWVAWKGRANLVGDGQDAWTIVWAKDGLNNGQDDGRRGRPLISRRHENKSTVHPAGRAGTGVVAGGRCVGTLHWQARSRADSSRTTADARMTRLL